MAYWTTSTEVGESAKNAKIQSSTILAEILRNIFSKDNPVMALKFHHANAKKPQDILGVYTYLIVKDQCPQATLVEEVCVEYTCDKTHPHHLRQDPEALHYYRGCARKLVAGGVEVLFIGDTTAESTQVLKNRRSCQMRRPTNLSCKITQFCWKILHCHVSSTWAVYIYVCVSRRSGVSADFSLMNNIKIKSRNRMNTDTLDDRMMICSNGPAVSAENTQEIHVIVDLAFEHWSQALTRMPSQSHPGVLRPRAGGGVEVEVHDILNIFKGQKWWLSQSRNVYIICPNINSIRKSDRY